PDLEHEHIRSNLQNIRHNLARLSDTFGRGRLIREGIRVTLVGRPNVGKSSLFNSLLGHSRAIVTSIPGTTRDTISESIVLGGVPVLLTDTAGLRTSGDEIESIGIDRTKREAADSDLVIVVMDGSQPLSAEDRRVLTEVSNQRHLVAVNKSDLPTFSAAWPEDGEADTTVPVSPRTNARLEQLGAAILQ